MSTANRLAVHTMIAWAAVKQRLAEFADDDRGEISSSLVWVAGFVLAAIVVVGILYVKLQTAAEQVEVDPGVG